MNFLAKLGQYLTGAQNQVQAATDQLTSAIYAGLGLLLVADILLLFIFFRMTSRRS